MTFDVVLSTAFVKQTNWNYLFLAIHLFYTDGKKESITRISFFLISLYGIIQMLRKAVFGENLPLPPPLVTARNVSNMSPPSVT